MSLVIRIILFMVTFCYYAEIKKNTVGKISYYNIIFVRAKKNFKKSMHQFPLNSKRNSNFEGTKRNHNIVKYESRKRRHFFLNSRVGEKKGQSEIKRKIIKDEDKYNIIKDIKKYCECTKKYKRLPTREVTIGNVKIGNYNNIAIQTMTNCDTRNIEECVNQIKKCKDLGADMVRLTVQGVQEAEASYHIKEKLLSENITIPLVADIHFNPKIALMAAEVYEKIRVNPGNFVDGRKKWINKVYKKKEFEEGKLFIKEKFVPLIEKCKRLNRAIRIGTNHGSLSSRILSYYGDTPLGMIESAFEFSDLCIENKFYNIVFSMKASNAYVMIQSYRLLVAKQYERDKNGLIFPMHLGVTEAGFGANGRIKSYLGIGSLLYDGIGDTIRISLTEDPWDELAPCKKLIENLKKRIFYTDKKEEASYSVMKKQNKEGPNYSRDTPNNDNDVTVMKNSLSREIQSCSPEKKEEAIIYKAKENSTVHSDTDVYQTIEHWNSNCLNFEENFRDFNNIVKNRVDKKVKSDVLHEECTVGNVVTVKELEDSLQIFKDLNIELDQNGNLKKGAKTTDIIIIDKFETLTDSAKKTVKKLIEIGLHVLVQHQPQNIDIVKKLKINDSSSSYNNNIIFYTHLENMDNILEYYKDEMQKNNSKGYALILNGKENIKMVEKIKNLDPAPLFLLLRSDTVFEHVLVTRRVNEIIHSLGINVPYIHYVDIHSTYYEDILVNASLYVGTCLIDLMGDGLIINVTNYSSAATNTATVANAQKDEKQQISSRVSLNSFLTLNILQDTRIRLFKTDYIACPSCGRTLFNIQETTKKIMKLTGHLKGVKIAIMGCIVNGIGEMADAHFGYVGSAPKKVDLYYGKEIVERNVPEEEAYDKLIELIKKHNKWQDP
ncbi:4-hydroxy-3-methylbut-2-en-1-yl diphosphate synthase (ferredoxin) [Plasmodium brasilianum]|uniref:4-hydroxy-3-methylbut-2-en-1-yl diphosphate synthase (ferredoxin), chloroplastic n=2 Tax=Plasmodium (Plasmodium) TaxID=418103 RepID=A0A1D3RIJ7_PLAMA|nr:4-hydroxy-3-methylbut-2-en-1-yl diphosphate synthase, putative [Plasmodium malariae]KAI4837868.1 4-hydroxy-3-methylbut-2-en-1-yl diphosphate synthase (ferredoxin) [Plasmodium brasilianum]SCN44981.1 4-hydroxy-3-methylbut-2-en-1-yl diphosphate synthase, putative [Plasmodium malariae]